MNEIQEQWHLDSIRATDSFAMARGKGIKVAVLDSGIDAAHEDLREALFYVDTAIPDKYYGKEFDAGYQGIQDYAGHGTHVAGIIAARDNAAGVTGVAPESELICIKVIEKTQTAVRGKSAWIAAGMNQAVANGADIINLSIGGNNTEDELLRRAIDNAEANGITVVCSAGNTYGQSRPMYPAILDNTIAVSAAERYGNTVRFAASYSNHGSFIDICAPGSDIMSTLPGKYGIDSGTSMACPMVAGALADFFSISGRQHVSWVRDILRKSATDMGEQGWDEKYGWGYLNIEKMLKIYLGMQELQAPRPQLTSGSSVCESYAIRMDTETEDAKIVYTVDGTEPDAASPVYPEEGLKAGAESIMIKARNVSGDGELSDTVACVYNVIPDITKIAEENLRETYRLLEGYIPDPVCGYPARIFSVELMPEESLTVMVEGNTFPAQLMLYDRYGKEAEILGAGEEVEFGAGRLYARLLALDGSQSEGQQLNLYARKSSSGSLWGSENDRKFSIGKTMGFTLPDSIPVIGNTDIDLSLDKIPGFVEVSDGEIKIGIGMDKKSLDDVDKDDKKSSFQKARDAFENYKKGKKKLKGKKGSISLKKEWSSDLTVMGL